MWNLVNTSLCFFYAFIVDITMLSLDGCFSTSLRLVSFPFYDVILDQSVFMGVTLCSRCCVMFHVFPIEADCRWFSRTYVNNITSGSI